MKILPHWIFFVNPPEGSEHGQKCIESKKNNTLYYKKPVATPNFCKQNFSSCFFWLQVSKIAAKLGLEKNDISDMVHPRKILLAESWGSSRFFIVKKLFFFDLMHFWPCSEPSGGFLKNSCVGGFSFMVFSEPLGVNFEGLDSLLLR